MSSAVIEVVQPDLCEQPQGLGVVGDRARQAEQPGIALEDDDLHAGRAEEIGDHQSDRAGADDRDLAGRRRDESVSGLHQHFWSSQLRRSPRYSC